MSRAGASASDGRSDTRSGSRAGALDLNGVIIPAVTPFDPVTGDVDVVALRHNLRRWFEHPIRGVLLGGSTGEAVLLDDEERLKVVEAAAEVVPDDRILMVGTGAESTRATIRRGDAVAGCGADAVLVQPPAFYRGAMTPGVLRDHYRAVADRSPVPVLLYQVPLRFATLEFPTGLVAELSEHPNIMGMKDSRGDLALLGEVAEAVRDDFQLLSGSGAGLFAALQVGAVGGILGVANLLPAACARIVEAVAEESFAEAGALQEQVGPVHRAVVGGMGVPGVKAALDLLGFRGGRPRPPLPPLPEARRAELKRVLEGAGCFS